MPASRAALALALAPRHVTGPASTVINQSRFADRKVVAREDEVSCRRPGSESGAERRRQACVTLLLWAGREPQGSGAASARFAPLSDCIISDG